MHRFPAALVLMLGAVSACADVPEFDRPQVLTVSRASFFVAARKSYAAVLDALRGVSEMDGDAALAERCSRILPKLLQVAWQMKPESKSWRWELHITSSNEVEAFASPTGELLLSSAFVEQLQLTDAELALTLGHEVAHVIAEHARELASTQRALETAGEVASLGNRVLPATSGAAVDEVSGRLVRMQESEADQLGMLIAQRAGFRPTEMVNVFDKVQALIGTVDVAGHPSISSRARNAKAFAAVLETM